MKKNKTTEEPRWTVLAKFYFDRQRKSIESGEKGTSHIDDPGDVSNAIDDINLYYKLKRFDSEHALMKVREKMQSKKPTAFTIFNNYRFLRIAAILILAVMLGSIGFYLGSAKLVKNNTSAVVVDNYGLSRVELDDGSIVTMNHDTKINYPKKFKGNTREVSLEGEAFFEIEPNPDKPFIIHTGDVNIRVLGTSFNLTAYPDEKKVEVVVEKGSVQVYKTNMESSQTDEVILAPGEKGLYDIPSKRLDKSQNDNVNFLSWKTREITFKKTNLKDVTELLSKVYRVQIITGSAEVDSMLLTTEFDNKSIDFVLDVIALTHDLEVEKKDDIYFLR